MTAKLTIESVRGFGKERGFELLSTEYKNALGLLSWKCSKGHEWEARFGNIQQGQGCPHCADKKHTIESVRAFGLKKGFELLSTEYKNAHGLLSWKCKNGHEWKTCFGNIQQGQGCPHCVNNRKKATIEQIRSVGLEKGFELLSNEYENAHQKLSWKCHHGHIWTSCFNSIQQGKGCPHCKNKTEQKVRALLEAKFNKPFPSVWFKHPNGKKFQLDCFCPELKLAIEYDGQQHFIPIEAWGGEEALENIRHRDALKDARCKDLGIRLVRVAYTEDIETAIANI